MIAYTSGVEYDDEQFDVIVFAPYEYPITDIDRQRLAELQSQAELPNASFALKEVSGGDVRFTLFLEKAHK